MGVLRYEADRSFAIGQFLVTALRLLNQRDKPGLDAWVAAQEGSVSQSLMFTPGGNDPDYYVASGSTGWALALIDGCRTSQLAGALIDGYTPPFTGGTPGFVNSWADRVSDILQALMDGKGMSGETYITCGGHSGGGVVAQLLARKQKDRFPAGRQRWQSFGQPKTGLVDAARVGGRVEGVRWMWHADPIPLVPLSFADAPFLLPIIGFRQMLSWSNMVHWAGGWQMVPGQIGHPEELPTSSSVSPFTSVSAWVFSQESGSGTNHAIADYENFMRAEAPFITLPQSSLRHVAPIETPPAVDRRTQTVVERNVVASIVNAEHRQNAVPVSIPVPQAFRAVRNGRTWLVTFGGVEIAIAATRRGAKGLARDMNVAMSRLQRAAVVDPAALQSQLGEYLAAASDPAGPFRPVLNTTF